MRWHISKINSKEFSSWDLTARKFRKTELLSWHIPSGHKVPPTVSQSATFPRTKSLFLGLSSRSLKVLHFLTTSLILGLRRLKVLHFLGKPLLQSLKVPHFWNISVSRPLFPASQSATFPREISDFSTLALSPRSLEVLHFLIKSIILGLWPSLPSVSQSATFPWEKPLLPSLKVTHFPEKKHLGLWPSLPSVSKCYISLGNLSSPLSKWHISQKNISVSRPIFIP